jgi:hypothetical protein
VPLDTRQYRAAAICLHARKSIISHVLAGQLLGIKKVDDGIWLVSFVDYNIGYIDLEQKTSHIGPRLSPRS